MPRPRTCRSTGTERIPAPIIYFVRHGETDWNREARLQGQRDVPLNRVGREQAAAVGGTLAALLTQPAALDYVASPFGRTRDTMAILREALGLAPDEYRVDDRLKEITFGRWEGMTWREVRAREAAAAAQRVNDKWHYVPPGGESYAMLAARIAPVVREIVRDTVVVAHGGVARAFIACLGLARESDAPQIDIWQGRVLVLEPGAYRWV